MDDHNRSDGCTPALAAASNDVEPAPNGLGRRQLLICIMAGVAAEQGAASCAPLPTEPVEERRPDAELPWPGSSEWQDTDQQWVAPPTPELTSKNSQT